MDARDSGTLLAYRLAEEVPPLDVTGTYDPQQQLWVGGHVSVCMTTTYSGTRCQTVSVTHTNCGADSDGQYDNCSDSDYDDD